MHCSDLAHDHIFLGDGHERNTRRTLWVVALTGIAMVVEVAAGLVFNSMALLADGLHMATHAGALGIAAGAYIYAKRHAHSGRYTFGTGKVGDLAGFASAVSLLFVAAGIGVESVGRLFEPKSIAFAEAIAVAVLGLIVNVVSALMLGTGHHHGHDHGHDHHHGGSTHRDNNMRAALAHVLTDALTSVFAIVALILGYALGWVWLDPAMGVVGMIVIGIWALSLMRDAAKVLLDATNPALEEKVRACVAETGTGEITDLHVWRIGPGGHAAIVSVSGPAQAQDLKAGLAEIGDLAHVTVETH